MTSNVTAQSGQQASNAWRVLIILFLVNLLNFFDRTIPAIVLEPLRLEFDLSDTKLALLSAVFTLVYAIAGIPLGRISDTKSRKGVLAIGLTVWSALTAATGLAWNYTSLLFIRMGVGIGEASCAPAATSMIGDLFPSEKRGRALGIFMLGLPLGLLLAFFTIGKIVEAFDGDWRVPFFIAAVPGFFLAVIVLLIREPARGAAEETAISEEPIDQPIRKVLQIRTVWWIIASGIFMQMAIYSTTAFMVALFQRYFELPIATAAGYTGIIIGLTGLITLTLGASISDRMHQWRQNGRLIFGALACTIAGIAIFVALAMGRSDAMLFMGFYALGALLFYTYFTSVYPAMQDVVGPRLRATAMALYFAGQYVLGGFIGPVLVGVMSDNFAESAMINAGATEMTDRFKALGLFDAMYLVPVALVLTGIAVFMAAKSFNADNDKMMADMGAPDGA